MIQQRLKRLWQYNEWGWSLVWPSLARLAAAEPEAYFRERPLFWGSLHGLAAHCLAAEETWLTRLQGESPGRLRSGADFADFPAVQAAWEPFQIRWRAYLAQLTDEGATAAIRYRNTAGTPFELQAQDIVQHVVNHATEHRSQMTPVLFQHNQPTEPLDYMRFCLTAAS